MSLDDLMIGLKARGNFGHKGRPGKRGGSLPKGGGSSTSSAISKPELFSRSEGTSGDSVGGERFNLGNGKKVTVEHFRTGDRKTVTSGDESKNFVGYKRMNKYLQSKFGIDYYNDLAEED